MNPSQYTPGLAEHAPHGDATDRRELIAQESRKAVAGNHPQSALVQIAGGGKRPVLYCRDFKLGARHSTLQAQVDLGHPDVPVRIVPCGCECINSILAIVIAAESRSS